MLRPVCREYVWLRGRARGAHHPDPAEGITRPAGAAPPAQRGIGYKAPVPLGPPEVVGHVLAASSPPNVPSPVNVSV